MAASGERTNRGSTKLSYRESRELAQLPEQIEALEREQRELADSMSRPDYHLRGAEQLKLDGLRLAEIEQQLGTAFARWEDLEARSATLKANGPA